MTTFIALVAAIPALLMPAAATVPPGAVPTLDTTAAATATAPARVDTRRYCVIDDVSGSRIPRKQCQTRDGWAKDGVDIDELMK